MTLMFKTMLSNIKTQNIIFFIFLVLYASLIIYLGYIINIWEDEAYSLNTTSISLKDVVFESYNFEGQPPVYFILLTLWRLINPGIFFARLFSIIFIGLAAIYFYRIVIIVSDSKIAKWLVIIFLLNPFTVWAAIEIRTYSLLIFLATISIYFFIRYIFFEKKRDLYYFLVLSLIGIYTQYFFVFLVATLAFSLLLFRGWKAFYKLCLYLLPVVILFLPNLIFIKDNLAIAYSDNMNYSLIQRFSLAFKSAQNIVLAFDILSHEKILRWSARAFFIFFVMFAYIKLFKGRQSLTNYNFEKYNALIVSLATLLTFFTFYLVVTGIKFNDRYMAIVFPMLILLFIIFKEYSPFIKNLVYSIISIYFSILLFVRYSDAPIKTYDYQSVANYIDKIAYPNEPILLNSRTISIPFHYYYYGASPLIPIPDTFKHTKDGFQVLITDTIQLEQLIRSEISNSKSILFINDNLLGYSYKLKLTSKMMDQFLCSHYNITLDTLFFGKSRHQSLKIRRLESIYKN